MALVDGKDGVASRTGGGGAGSGGSSVGELVSREPVDERCMPSNNGLRRISPWGEVLLLSTTLSRWDSSGAPSRPVPENSSSGGVSTPGEVGFDDLADACCLGELPGRWSANATFALRCNGSSAESKPFTLVPRFCRSRSMLILTLVSSNGRHLKSFL